MTFSKKRCLLTGATGFVGKQVLKELQDKDYEISLVVRNGWEEKVNNKNKINNVFKTEDLFFESVEWWSSVCENIDVVVHVAWYADAEDYLLSNKNIDCLTGTLNLAKGAVLAGVSRIIGIGTCIEYDLSAGMLSVNTPLKPTTLYAASKVATYVSLSHYLKQKNVEFSWCRVFYLYGEGEDKRRLVPYIRSKLKDGKIAELTSGNQIRDFLEVSVAGKMIAGVVCSETYGVFNICSGIPITVRQFSEKIADEYGERKLLKFGARNDNLADAPCIVGII